MPDGDNKGHVAGSPGRELTKRQELSKKIFLEFSVWCSVSRILAFSLWQRGFDPWPGAVG